MKINNISIVIPILNEEKNLIRLIKEIEDVKNQMNLNNFEIILVDDNSTDNTHEILNNIKSKKKFIRYFIRKKKKKRFNAISLYWVQ